jgi:hypothetical protein
MKDDDPRLKPCLACLTGPVGVTGHPKLQRSATTARGTQKRPAYECAECGTTWWRSVKGVAFAWVKASGPTRFPRKA